MAAGCALRVLPHDLLEEVGDVIEACVTCVPHVLAVVVSGLQRVVLQADQVVADIVESGFTGCHMAPPECLGTDTQDRFPGASYAKPTPQLAARASSASMMR